MRNPRDFEKPLAIGAPTPVSEIPFKPSRMIHFLDFSNEKMVAKVPDIAPTVDILLGNLEDAIPVDRKEAARAGLIKVGKEIELGDTALWTRVNALESPWVLDDLTQVVEDPGALQRVDPGPESGLAEIGLLRGLDQALARRLLAVDRDRVLEVAEQDVGLLGDVGSLGDHLLVGEVEEVDHPRRLDRNLAQRLRRSDRLRVEEVSGVSQGAPRVVRSGAGGNLVVLRLCRLLRP